MHFIYLNKLITLSLKRTSPLLILVIGQLNFFSSSCGKFQVVMVFVPPPPPKWGWVYLISYDGFCVILVCFLDEFLCKFGWILVDLGCGQLVMVAGGQWWWLWENMNILMY